MKYLLSFSILSLFTSIAFATNLQSLDQSQVNKALKDKTITTVPLVTIDGDLVNNTFTGFFGKDGKLEGRMAAKPDNGPEKDTGTWKVDGKGVLCATWDHWNNKQSICVSIYKVGNGLLFVNDKTKKLETVVLDDKIQNGNSIT
jgi:hypothetical protein